jgi:hypothetical protein
VTVYLLCFPESSTTTCMLFLLFPSFTFSPLSSSISSILLPSEGITVVLLLRTSVALSRDIGFSRLLSSTSEKSEVASAVHVSRASSVGLFESPWKACDIVDLPLVIDVKSGLEPWERLAVLWCSIVEADQSFAWMLLISGDARVHATFMLGVTCGQLSSKLQDRHMGGCTKRLDVRQQAEVLAYAIRNI